MYICTYVLDTWCCVCMFVYFIHGVRVSVCVCVCVCVYVFVHI